jgi:hypothetical protein
MIMLTRILFLTLILLCRGLYESVEAQDTLVLAGRASNVRLIEEDSRSLSFEVQLQLTLRNASTSTAILYSHDFMVYGNELFAKTDKGAAELLHQRFGPSSTDFSPVWGELRQKLNMPAPPNDLTRLLQSEQWIEINRTVVLRFAKGKGDRSTWAEIRVRSPLFLQVAMEMFPSNLDYEQGRKSTNAFGKSLQSKWRRFGRLQVKPIRSEPIQIQLPEG